MPPPSPAQSARGWCRRERPTGSGPAMLSGPCPVSTPTASGSHRPGAGVQRVPFVQRRRIPRPDGRRDSALGVSGCCSRRCAPLVTTSTLPCSAASSAVFSPGDPAANDDVVVPRRCHFTRRHRSPFAIVTQRHGRAAVRLCPRKDANPRDPRRTRFAVGKRQKQDSQDLRIIRIGNRFCDGDLPNPAQS